MADLENLDENEYGQEETTTQSLANRLEAGEPIFEPTTLNKLADADLPLRGPLRQRMAEVARQRARNRRTLESVSNRVASNVARPITEVIQETLQGTVRDGIQSSVTSMTADNANEDLMEQE